MSEMYVSHITSGVMSQRCPTQSLSKKGPPDRDSYLFLLRWCNKQWMQGSLCVCVYVCKVCVCVPVCLWGAADLSLHEAPWVEDPASLWTSSRLLRLVAAPSLHPLPLRLTTRFRLCDRIHKQWPIIWGRFLYLSPAECMPTTSFYMSLILHCFAGCFPRSFYVCVSYRIGLVDRRTGRPSFKLLCVPWCAYCFHLVVLVLSRKWG